MNLGVGAQGGVGRGWHKGAEAPIGDEHGTGWGSRHRVRVTARVEERVLTGWPGRQAGGWERRLRARTRAASGAACNQGWMYRYSKTQQLHQATRRCGIGRNATLHDVRIILGREQYTSTGLLTHGSTCSTTIPPASQTGTHSTHTPSCLADTHTPNTHSLLPRRHAHT